MNDNEDRKYVICPCCGATVPFGKFCPECGSVLSGASETTAPKKQPAAESAAEQTIGFFSPISIKGCMQGMVINDASSDQEEVSDGPKPVDDSNLTLLGDFCKKTVATVGGDGYDETVLYENEEDGSFQIHTYMKYEYMPKEIHRSFKAKDGAYDALLELAEKLHLEEYEGKRGCGLCGGMYICKYRKDGVLHRVTTDNFGTDGSSIINQVGRFLGSFIGEEIFQQ